MYSSALTPHAVKIMVNDAVKAGVLKKVKADKVDLQWTALIEEKEWRNTGEVRSPTQGWHKNDDEGSGTSNVF